MRMIGLLVSLSVIVGSTATWAQLQQPPHYTIKIGQSDDKLLPEGAALCVALGVKPEAPCDDDVILEQSQRSTDKTLWIEKTISGLDNPPLGHCLRPIAIMTYGDGGFIHVCHTPDEDDTVNALDIQRLQDVAVKLNSDPDKTLAKHRWIMNFKSLWERVN